MEYMAKKGYVCVIHDHRGHGKSVRALDDLGYMYGGGADAILKDIEVVNREMHQGSQLARILHHAYSDGMMATPSVTTSATGFFRIGRELMVQPSRRQTPATSAGIH